MAKQRKSRVALINAEERKDRISAFKRKGDIPTPEQTEKVIDRHSKEIVPYNPKSHRKKFTTMLHPILTKRLKQDAISQDKSAADLLEKILMENYGIQSLRE